MTDGSDPAADTADAPGSLPNVPDPPDATTPLSRTRALPAGRGPQAFAPGDVVAGRYRIVQFIARGGMGEVYEASDTALGEQVALKTILPRRGDDEADEERSLDRFKREIHLAHRVTHPNVCRIFDLGVHRAGDLEVHFLTMEMLAGETLSERLRRDGRMQPAAALPLVAQMAEALAAAHRVGVVHRDFKSSNVMLVPAEHVPGGFRAVVTDFGLAHVDAAAGLAGGTISEAGMVLGTPSYMAPEQVRGERATPATDVYALGVVLFEMATGRLPFIADSAMAAAVLRLTNPPPRPRSLVAELPETWERVIMRCLEREATARFDNVAEVPRALGAPEPSTIVALGLSAVVRAIAPGRRRGLAVALLAVAALGAGGLWLALRRESKPAPLPAGVPDTAAPATGAARRSIAVLGFRNLKARSEDEWLATALAEMLTTEISSGTALRAVPGENVARMRLELGLDEPGPLGEGSLAKVKRNLGVDWVLFGTYLLVPGTPRATLRVDVRLQEARTGEMVGSLSQSGGESDLIDLVSALGKGLRAQLGTGGAGERGAVKAALPENLDAARLYTEGLVKLRLFEYAEARVLLERATAADPRHALAHSALATAFAGLGDEARARQQAAKAFELSAKAPRQARLASEARLREAERDWPRAEQTWRALFSFYPDELEYGLRLANSQVRGARGREALATAGEMRARWSEEPRVDLAEAAAAAEIADLPRTLAAAERAAAKADAAGARLIAAQASYWRGWVAQQNSRLPDARVAYEAARHIYETVGDRANEARMLNNLAETHRVAGGMAAAEDLYQRSVAILRASGDRSGEARVLNNLGLIEQGRGNLAEARKLFESSLAMKRELSDTAGVARGLNNLAQVLAAEGNLAGARSLYEESLALRKGGSDAGTVSTLINLAALLRQQGEIGEARRRLEEALAAARAQGDSQAAAIAERDLAALTN